MTMMGTRVWGGRETGVEITRYTDDRVERPVADRTVETCGRCNLIADGRIGCSRLIDAPAGMPFRDRRAAARYAPRVNFRTDRLSSGRHGESEFGNGKGCGGRKIGLKLRHVGSYLQTPVLGL